MESGSTQFLPKGGGAFQEIKDVEVKILYEAIGRQLKKRTVGHVFSCELGSRCCFCRRRSIELAAFIVR